MYASYICVYASYIRMFEVTNPSARSDGARTRCDGNAGYGGVSGLTLFSPVTRASLFTSSVIRHQASLLFFSVYTFCLCDNLSALIPGLVEMDTWRVVSVGVALAGVYLYLLNKRLHAMRYKPETPIPSDEEILRSTEDWRAKGPLDGSGVEHATGKRYTVIGGCGAVGIVFVQTLHGRGERNIVVIDLSPLPPALASLEGVSAIKTDISSLESVREAFASAKPDVVFHLAAAVRFYERLAYTLPWSARINADGTKNVLDALAELDDSSEKIYVYCSSASLPSATSSFFLLGLDGGTSTNPVYKDGDCAPGTTPLSHNYPITKAQAEAFVVQANGKNGLKAGVVSFVNSVCQVC